MAGIGIGLVRGTGAVTPPVGMSVDFTFPTPGSVLVEGQPYLITGTISEPALVDFKLGSVIIGGAASDNSALTWAFYFVPTAAQVGGGQFLNATANALTGGAVGNSASLAVTIQAVVQPNAAVALSEMSLSDSPIGGGKLDPGVPITSFTDSRAPEPGSPAGVSPNTYSVGDSFRRTRITVQAGVTSLDIVAVPINNRAFATTIGVFIDGVYNQTLTYSGTFGVRATQTLSLDGSAHTIDLEDQALLVDVVGAFKWIGRVIPEIDVSVVGDSITAGAFGSVSSKGWAPQLRRLLPSNYGTTIWGISGRTMVTNGGIYPSVVARLRGTVKNVIVLALQVNDWANGATPNGAPNNYAAALLQFIQGVASVSPNTRILLVSSPPKTTPVNGFGRNIQEFRDVMALYAQGGGSAQANVYYCDLSTVYPTPPYSTYAPDDTHPNDTGMGLIVSAVYSALIAIP